MQKLSILVTAAAMVSSQVVAGAPQTSISQSVKADYEAVRDLVIRSAEKMPASDYAFKPTADVRSFAQQIAHVADDQYNLCSPARGETRKAAYEAIEHALSTKDDLIPALRQAFAYCDAAYASLTDASAAQPTNSKTGRTRFGMLNWNVWHTWEHYGNIIVYLRLKGLVPPSSEPSR